MNQTASLLVYGMGFAKLFEGQPEILAPLFSADELAQHPLHARFLSSYRELSDPGIRDNWQNAQLYTPCSVLANFHNSDYPTRAELRYFPICQPMPQSGLNYPQHAVPLLATDQLEAENLKQLKKDCADEIQKLGKKPSDTALRFLAEKYLSGVGVMLELGGEKEPYPLFDVLRVIAALLSLPDTPYYRLATLDVSGIQQFVYNIASNRALRSLRGRSLFLEIVAQAVLAEVLEVAGATQESLFVTGGGSYTLLLPDLDEGKEQELKDTLERWNKRLFHVQEGRLYLAFGLSDASHQLEAHDLLRTTTENYAKARASMEKCVKLDKARKFRWLKDEKELGPTEAGIPCNICRRHVPEGQLLDLSTDNDQPEPDPVRICDLCNFLIELGKIAIESESLTITALPGPKWQLPNPKGYRRTVVNLGPHPGPHDHDLPIQFNPATAVQVQAAGTSLILSTPVALQPGQTNDKIAQLIDLNELADRSEGWRGLGAIRADADNVGQLISGENPVPLVNLVSLSRLLNLFFAGYVSRLIQGSHDIDKDQFRLVEVEEKQPQRNFLLIYGGGDDLFGIGAWHDVMELAFDLGRSWKCFTGQHPRATLSLGLSLHESKYPVAAVADLSGESLNQQAKKNFLPALPLAKTELERASALLNHHKTHEKDSLAVNLARRPYFWSEIYQPDSSETLPISNFLCPMYRLLKAGKISRNFLRRLIEADAAIHPLREPQAPRTPDERKTADESKKQRWKAGVKYEPAPEGKVKLLYVLTSASERNLQNNNDDQIKKDWKTVFEFLKSVYFSDEPADLLMYLNWLDLLNR